MNEQDKPTTTKGYKKYYNESSFWAKVKKLGGKALKPALTLYYVMKSPQTPALTKATILGALGYLILPTDIIPDFIPIAGYSDDIAALWAVVKQCNKHITPQIKEQVEKKILELTRT